MLMPEHEPPQCQYKRHDFWMSRTTVTENGKKFGGIISQILF
jgi:hypothetical protein